VGAIRRRTAGQATSAAASGRRQRRPDPPPCVCATMVPWVLATWKSHRAPAAGAAGSSAAAVLA